MPTTEQLVTIEDIEQLSDSECRYDLIRGKLVEMTPAGGPHGKIAAGIIGRLWVHVSSNNLGDIYTSETGFILARDPDVMLAPDAAFLRPGRAPSGVTSFYEVAPDLVVEVISPNDSVRYVTDKVMEYLDAGVPLVWLVDPDRKSVTVYNQHRTARILSADETLDGGDILPGFSVLIAEIFK